ncbi:MAG: SRPBCC domain-containing protein [Acidimicrobiales bacterium]
MTVIDVSKDFQARTLTFSADFSAPIQRVWQLWEDPRQLERWWGPPTWPATFTQHELVEGGTMKYYMTGPEGVQSRGWWRMIAVDPPHSLEFESGFSDETGAPSKDTPSMNMLVTLSEEPSGVTRMVVQSSYPTKAFMDKVMEMGMEEGMKGALSQIDGLL